MPSAPPPWNEDTENAVGFADRLPGDVRRPGFTADWLVGAREMDELAVRSAARGTGLAAQLLKAVTADAARAAPGC